MSKGIHQVGEYAGDKLDQGIGTVTSIGGMAYLLADTLRWAWLSLTTKRVRFDWTSLQDQMVRVGVDSIGIVMLVQVFIGGILALQLAPTLESYGQLEQVAVVVAIAIVRELGPLITAIVLSGFAGASIGVVSTIRWGC